MIWNIIKNSASDFWEEMLYLVIFNIFWMMGTLLLVTYPLVTFGLFFSAYEVGEGKGIKLGTFFHGAKQMWKQALLWGVINLVVLLVLGSNFNFYGTLEAQWASLAQMVTLAFLMAWVVLQLFMLAFYPRLTQPGFKLAARYAMVAIGRYPLLAFLLAGMVLLVLALSSFFPAIFFLGAFAWIALVANRVAATIVEREKRREADDI
jgi:hypothetical protein